MTADKFDRARQQPTTLPSRLSASQPRFLLIETCLVRLAILATAVRISLSDNIGKIALQNCTALASAYDSHARIVSRKRDCKRVCGTSHAGRAFASGHGGDHALSMTTYLAGVGTVVGALALGFGGGVVLTNTAIKDTPAGPTRIERVMRSEPIAAPQGIEAKAIPMSSVDPAPAIKPVVEPVPVIQPQPVFAEVPKETQRAKEVEQPNQPELAKQAEQKEAEQRKTAERKIDRQKRYAERKPRVVAATRM
jgi:hypothetical protein